MSKAWHKADTFDQAYITYLRIQKYLNDENEEIKSDATAFKLYATVVYLCEEAGSCRLPTRDLALLTGISNGAIGEKLEKLERHGYISTYRPGKNTRETRQIFLTDITLKLDSEDSKEEYVLFPKQKADQYNASVEDAACVQIGDKTIRIILQDVSQDNASHLL